jgi:glycosyltransferase involved in cell wall biosynthesis
MTVPDGWDLELIVVDDGSTDGTWGEMASWRLGIEKFCPIRQSNGGPARARNRGVESSAGDIVLFLGDDTVPQAGWLVHHLEQHRVSSQPVAVLGYTSFPPSWRSPFLRWINEYGAQFGYQLIDDPGSVAFNFFYTSNISLPRSVFLELGGFREDFPAAAWEDIELAFRGVQRGLRMVYQPRARALHLHRIRPRTFRHRQRTAGRSGAVFAELHPGLGDFLGAGRLTTDRRRLSRFRWLLYVAVELGELLPGGMPPRVYQWFVDQPYLQGLAEGLQAPSDGGGECERS